MMPLPTRRKSIVIDGRIIFRAQCRGIGRAVIGLVEQFPSNGGDGAVKMLVQKGGYTPFDLTAVAKRVELVETDLPVVALHRVGAARRLLEELDAAVLFSPYHPLAPLAAPCPVVSAVHDCIWEQDPAFAGGRTRQLGFLALSRLSLRRAAAVTVPSKATAAAVKRNYPHVETEVVPNGVTFRAPGADGAASVNVVRAELGLPERYLIHVGARRPHKNQPLLVELLARLDKSVSLVLVGTRDPRMDDDLDQQIQRLGLEDRVMFLDNVTDDLMPGLYGGATAFVFPSLAEGFGIPPLEAMVAGTPVVASAIPVVAEVCGGAATLVSPYDLDGWVEAVERLLTDPTAVEHAAEQGRLVAHEAGWERGGTALYELLRRVGNTP